MRAMRVPSSFCVSFGVFQFNPQTGELFKQGMKRKLWPHAAKLLARLLERPGEVYTREDLQQRLWPKDASIDLEHNLNKTVHVLREALGDAALGSRYVETVAGVGYRFSDATVKQRFARRLKQRRMINEIAVLPLMSEDSDDELKFLKRRIVERLIDEVSRIPQVRVRAYHAVQSYDAREFNLRTIAEELLVGAVAAGEMVRRDGQLYLHLSVIGVGGGTQLGGAHFVEPLAESAACPERLADKICDQLRTIWVPPREHAA